MKTPFSYYGNKSKVAPLLWERFGDARVFVEPFGGALATLLHRPVEHKLHRKREVIGDLDCFVAHFWRAIRNDPAAVSHYAFDPVSSLELNVRHEWLMTQRTTVFESLRNPNWFDAKIAGWWLWGQHLCYGKHWTNPRLTFTGTIPFVRGWEGYRADTPEQLLQRFTDISIRLRNVVIIQGDWKATIAKGLLDVARLARATKAILLDPPYTKRSGRQKDLYVCDSMTVGDEAVAWAKIKAQDSTYRIAICGLVGEYDLPNWSVTAWNAGGGTKNAARERIWFSPGCLPSEMEAAS